MCSFPGYSGWDTGVGNGNWCKEFPVITIHMMLISKGRMRSFFAVTFPASRARWEVKGETAKGRDAKELKHK